MPLDDLEDLLTLKEEVLAPFEDEFLEGPLEGPLEVVGAIALAFGLISL